MLKHVKLSIIVVLTIAGFLLPNAVGAAPVINFNGNFNYTYENGFGTLNVNGLVGSIEGLTTLLLETGDPVSFTTTWDNNLSTFVDTQLKSGTGDIFLAGTVNDYDISFLPLPVVQILNISGSYTVLDGTLKGLFPSQVMFSSELTLGVGQMFTTMTQNYSGGFNGSVFATPVPSSWTLLCLGILSLSAFRRARYDDSIT